MVGAPIRRERKRIAEALLRQQVRAETIAELTGPNGLNVMFPNGQPTALAKALPPPPTPSVPTATPAAITPVIPEMLPRAVELALQDSIATLELRIDRFDPNFIKIKQLKAQAGATVAGILARVSPAAMKGQPIDRLESILSSLRGETAVAINGDATKT